MFVRHSASRLASMEPNPQFHSCHTGIYVVPADTMIRGAASYSLCSSILSGGLRVIGYSIRIVLLTLLAIGFTCAMSLMYLADYLTDVRSTPSVKSQRKVVRRDQRRPHAPVRRPTLQISSY